MSTIYRREDGVGDQTVGKIEPDGQVYSHDSFVGHRLVGKVDPNGEVYSHDSFIGHRLVGRVSPDGQVYREEKVFGSRLLGKVSDGQVYREEKVIGPRFVGRTEPASREGGAALLLLLMPETTATDPPSLLTKATELVAAAAAKDQIAPRKWRSGRKRPPDRIQRSKDSPGEVGPLQRVVGMAHASARNVFWAMDPTITTTVILRENEDPPDPPRVKNRALVQQRELFRDIKPFLVVLSGDYEFVVDALSELHMADLVIVCSEHATLRELQIPIVDDGWRSGDASIDRSVFFDHATLAKYRGKTISQILDRVPVKEKPGFPALVKEGGQMLKVGCKSIDVEDAKALIAGYCFGDKAGRWDPPPEGGERYASHLPDVTWRRWAYRCYDSIPPVASPELKGLDLLIPVGLNVTQGYGTELLERLMSAGRLVSETMAAVPEGATFWELGRNEIEPAGLPEEGSVSWALHRSWAILMSTPKCGVTITHKILHHKWPRLFPLIDRQTKALLAENTSWLNVHDDLTSQEAEFAALENWFDELRLKQNEGPALTRLRLHDIMLWSLATGEADEAIALGGILL